MTGPDSGEQVEPRSWRSVLPAVLSLSLMVVIGGATVYALRWFSNPPTVPYQEEQITSEPIAKDVPPYTFPAGVSEALGSAESLVIYLIGVSEDKSPRKESFHGIPVMGTAHVTSPQAVASIIEGLQRGVEHDQNEPMACFFPRHGVRVLLRDGRRIDLVICYYCQIMEVYVAEDPVGVFTYDDSRDSLNGALRAAGVDLEQPVPAFMPKP
jgi:hypothetical protein